jgi:hypothetical protein
LVGEVGALPAYLPQKAACPPLTRVHRHRVVFPLCPAPPAARPQALQQRYLEPPKSMRDAAVRAWRPIERRSLDWARRAAKAEAAGALSRGDLLAFYDSHLSPGSPRYRHMVTQIWGGGQAGGATGGLEEGGAAPDGVPPVACEFEVGAGQLADFKRSQPLFRAAHIVTP